MTPTTPKRVLRPAVFDAIKRGAEKQGGVGMGSMYKRPDCPVCGIGLAHAEGAIPIVPAVDGENWQLVDDRLYENSVAKLVGFSFSDSDTAVDAIVGSIHGPGARAPFEQWAEELGAVRGVELPAEVYDALKASAEKYGGIGYGLLRDHGTSDDGLRRSIPCCILGHACVAQPKRVHSPLYDSEPYGAFERALMTTFSREWLGVGFVSDDAVGHINRRKGAPPTSRVTFNEWADELNVLRAST